MAKQKKNIKASTAVMGVMIAVFGVIFLIIGLFVAKDEKEFRENALQTTGTITEITVDYIRKTDGKTKKEYDVYIEYTVDGIVYNDRLSYYDSSMHKGQSITLYYNPEDPSDVIGEKTGTGVFILVSCFFIILGIVFIIPSVLSGNKKKKLMESGEKVRGIITNVYVDNNISYNGRHPYRAECEVTDAFTGEVYLYSSERVMNDITHLMGSPVDVYYDPNNKKKYYIDLESAESENNTTVHDYR